MSAVSMNPYPILALIWNGDGNSLIKIGGNAEMSLQASGFILKIMSTDN